MKINFQDLVNPAKQNLSSDMILNLQSLAGEPIEAAPACPAFSNRVSKHEIPFLRSLF